MIPYRTSMVECDWCDAYEQKALQAALALLFANAWAESHPQDDVAQISRTVALDSLLNAFYEFNVWRDLCPDCRKPPIAF